MSVEIIRDPLWNNIRLDPLAFELIDTPAFQRLRDRARSERRKLSEVAAEIVAAAGR